jgi:hypothetical protein
VLAFYEEFILVHVLFNKASLCFHSSGYSCLNLNCQNCGRSWEKAARARSFPCTHTRFTVIRAEALAHSCVARDRDVGHVAGPGRSRRLASMVSSAESWQAHGDRRL